ncbi:hypothetical protein HDE_03711 [Halotydeus destructor]|nr:hypothetical protein HDE_03711 [Halotydeus destructor]
MEKRVESVASVVEPVEADSRKVLVHVCCVPGCSYKSLAKHYNMNRHYKTHPGFTKNFKTVQLTEAEFKFADKQVQTNKDD